MPASSFALRAIMSGLGRPRKISWFDNPGGSSPHGFIVVRDELPGPHPYLHYGFDGWQEPIRYTPLEKAGPALWLAQVEDLDGHVALDCAVTDGRSWSNNSGLDYRLWIGLDVVDSHLHISGGGTGALGLRSYLQAADSAGIDYGIV